MFEDNQALINIDRINLDYRIQIKYIDTENHFDDILIKGNFTRDEWNHLSCLFNISHFSSTVCSDIMAKRSQQDSGEERVTAISKYLMNLIARTQSFVSSSTSMSLGKKLRKSRSMEISCWRRQIRAIFGWSGGHVRAHVSCCVVQAEARGARVVGRNDECARIAARCAWCVCLRARCARHVDIHIRGHLAQNVVRLLFV